MTGVSVLTLSEEATPAADIEDVIIARDRFS